MSRLLLITYQLSKARPDEFGECDPGNGKIPGANGYKDGLLSLQGTSMATPLTAGHASLIRQYFEEGYYPNGIKGDGRSLTNPSATLIKAVLMNGAQVNTFFAFFRCIIQNLYANTACRT